MRRPPQSNKKIKKPAPPSRVISEPLQLGQKALRILNKDLKEDLHVQLKKSFKKNEQKTPPKAATLPFVPKDYQDPTTQEQVAELKKLFPEPPKAEAHHTEPKAQDENPAESQEQGEDNPDAQKQDGDAAEPQDEDTTAPQEQDEDDGASEEQGEDNAASQEQDGANPELNKPEDAAQPEPEKEDISQCNEAEQKVLKNAAAYFLWHQLTYVHTLTLNIANMDKAVKEYLLLRLNASVIAFKRKTAWYTYINIFRPKKMFNTYKAVIQFWGVYLGLNGTHPAWKTTNRSLFITGGIFGALLASALGTGLILAALAALGVVAPPIGVVIGLSVPLGIIYFFLYASYFQTPLQAFQEWCNSSTSHMIALEQESLSNLGIGLSNQAGHHVANVDAPIQTEFDVQLLHALNEHQRGEIKDLNKEVKDLNNEVAALRLEVQDLHSDLSSRRAPPLRSPAKKPSYA